MLSAYSPLSKLTVTSLAIPDPHARAETVAWFRSEIERDRHTTDIHAIESKITVTLREVRRLMRVP
ncbi:hypothetical protein SCLCIDRAFT_1210649 [Scleroderma citrinum Foug A]|uniref:Uncharacterized protein n=1 Tax=Scleroderma citrinum Foug A TaxID=1036808 RepID=A0A0C3A0I0_9AGAM|nr:hypothetical protein SCLCIDRAFT_1210649 [Scleroderma citrinum Foug A]